MTIINPSYKHNLEKYFVFQILNPKKIPVPSPLIKNKGKEEIHSDIQDGEVKVEDSSNSRDDGSDVELTLIGTIKAPSGGDKVQHKKGKHDNKETPEEKQAKLQEEKVQIHELSSAQM